MEFKGVTFRCEEAVDRSLFERLPEDLQDFYENVNGLIAYNGGLHIRSCTDTTEWHSLGLYWNGEEALSKTYTNLLESDIPFAQDCVGDQYFLREDGIWLLSAETGEVMDMEVDLDEFLENAIEDPVEYLAMEPLVHLLDRDGELSLGELIHVVPGLSLDLPEDTPYHIDSLPVKERITWLREFYVENTLKV